MSGGIRHDVAGIIIPLQARKIMNITSTKMIKCGIVQFIIYFTEIVCHTEYFIKFVFGDHHCDCFCCFDFFCLFKYINAFIILLIINVLY